MHLTRWVRAYFFMLLIYELPELSLCASVAASKVKHEGFCPNKLNSNLWVDAQSTCERECNVDEVVLLMFYPHCCSALNHLLILCCSFNFRRLKCCFVCGCVCTGLR